MKRRPMIFTKASVKIILNKYHATNPQVKNNYNLPNPKTVVKNALQTSNMKNTGTGWL